MKRIRILFLTGLLVITYNIYLTATDIDSQAGISGAKFLKINIGARPIALGESYTASGNDINSIYWNPAGLNYVKSRGVSLSHNKWLTDITMQNLSYVHPTKIGVFGGSLLYLHMGDIIARDTTGEQVDVFTCYDASIILSYAREIRPEIKVGVNLKIFQEALEKEQAIGFAVDLGGIYKTPVENLDAGLCIQNIGPEIKFISEGSPLPLNIKLGAGYKLLDDSLVLSLDITKPSDNRMYAGAGAEYVLGKIFMLRAGYSSRYDSNQGISIGAGFKVSDWIIDYAYVPYGKLDQTHRITISTYFGNSD